MKGQKSRSGGGVRPNFEGGQLPITKALPRMRGFTSNFRQEYHVVNLDRLSRFPANSEVTLQMLVDSGAVKDLKRPVKVLGRGDVDVALAVEAHKFSESARRKLEAAGGSVKEVG